MSKKKDKSANESIKYKKEEKLEFDKQNVPLMDKAQNDNQTDFNQQISLSTNDENFALTENEGQLSSENKESDLSYNRNALKKLHKQKLSKEEKAKIKQKKKKEEEKREKEYQKGTFMKNMKALGIILVLGIFTGSGLGVWYFNYALKSKVDYSLYTVADYMPNLDERFASLFGITEESDLSCGAAAPGWNTVREPAMPMLSTNQNYKTLWFKPLTWHLVKRIPCTMSCSEM